jgi:hypothetical protein
VPDHQAACHYAAEALKTDVGVAHIDATPVRRGTPEAALRSIRPEDGGIDAVEKTVAIEETSVGSERYNIDPDLTASSDDGKGTNPPA